MGEACLLVLLLVGVLEGKLCGTWYEVFGTWYNAKLSLLLLKTSAEV